MSPRLSAAAPVAWSRRGYYRRPIRWEEESAIPQPKHVMALKLVPRPRLAPEVRAYLARCREKLGFVPNVFRAYTLRPEKLRHFISTVHELMLGDSGLSRLEREMIAVVVSSANHCYYCLVAHGWGVRKLSGDPELETLLASNYRAAKLGRRQRAMLDFAWKLTVSPAEMGAADRRALGRAGFTDPDIFDIVDTAAFYNASNRVALALDMMPNREYQTMDR